MQHKKKFIAILALFTATSLAGCSSMFTNKNDKSDQNSTERSVPEKNSPIQPTTEKMEFSDPGNDEMGNEIKEIDNLINSAQTDYQEEALSDESISADAEIQ